jgi:PAS domain S-box-containing protein
MGPASQRAEDSFCTEVVGAISAGIISLDEDGTVVFATEQVDAILGRSPDDLIGHSIEKFLSAEISGEATLERIRESTDAPASSPVEVPLVHTDGHEVRISVAVTDIWYGDRRFFVLVFQQSTLDGQFDAFPHHADHPLFEAVCEQSSDAVFLIDTSADEFVEVNMRACELLQFDRETLCSLGPAGVHEHERDAFETFLETVLEDDTASTDSFSLRTADGARLPVTYMMSRVDIDGNALILASARPSTDEQRAAESLSTLGETYRTLLTAETERAIVERTTDVLQHTLDCTAVSFWKSNTDAEDGLELTATRAPGLDEDEPPPIQFDDDPATLLTDDEQLLENVQIKDLVSSSKNSAEKRLVIPVGNHGVVTVDRRSEAQFDDVDRAFVALVARSAATALDRLARERKLQHRSTALAETTDGTAIIDEHGKFAYVNDAYAELYGYDRPEVLVGESWRQLYDADEQQRFEWDVLPTVRTRGEWSGKTLGKRADGTTVPQELSLTALEDGGLVCVVRDLTDRAAYEEQLQALTGVYQELTRAETAEEVAGTGLRAISEHFGFDVGCVRFFDAETNTLETVAMTDTAEDLISSYPAFDLESTLAGRAYRREEVVHNEWDEEDPYVETTVRAVLHLPLGEHGVMTICTRAIDGFDDLETALVETLAASLQAALDRADREQTLRATERELQQQHERLEMLYRTISLIREIGDALIEATTRTELERTICTRVGNSELYRSAWIGEVGVAAERVDVRVGAGLEEGYLDVLDELPLEMLGSGTVQQALETGDIQVIRQYETRDGAGQDAEQTVEATAAIPLAYGERIHGVLVVEGTREDVFSDDSLAGFESLGKLAGFALTALQNREILLSDSIVELELTVTDDSIFASTLTDELDGQSRFERSVPIEDGRVLQYDLIQGANPTEVLELAEAADTVESAKVILEQDDGIVFQTITEQSLSQYALQAGASLQSATAEDGTVHVTLEAPQSADVREIVDAFDAAFDDVDVIAKREREHAVQTATEFRKDVAAQLTEKQRAALEAAYAAGYYDWPREVTAEELAESMGISSSTLHQHLRYGVQSLAEAFFEEPKREREHEHAPES